MSWYGNGLENLLVKPGTHHLASGGVGLDSDDLGCDGVQAPKEEAGSDSQREVGVEPNGSVQIERDASFADVARVGLFDECISFRVRPLDQNL